MEGITQLSPAAADFAGAVTSKSYRSADQVAAFLFLAGYFAGQRPAKPIDLPAELLLGLGQACRFASWEDNGVFVHVEAGLPRAEEHLARVIALQRGSELEAIVTDIAAKLIGLISQHFVGT